jgi:hypothetical protein
MIFNRRYLLPTNLGAPSRFPETPSIGPLHEFLLRAVKLDI